MPVISQIAKESAEYNIDHCDWLSLIMRLFDSVETSALMQALRRQDVELYRKVLSDMS